MISVVHPSRGRAQRAFNSYQRLRRNASFEFEYIICIERNDSDYNEYLNLFGTDAKVRIESGDFGCMTASLQHGAMLTTGDILMGFFDDFDQMPKGWDEQILSASKGRSFWLMNIDDCVTHHAWIHTLPIMDRAFFSWYGYIYHTAYKHMFGDTELACIGDMLGCTINARHIKFRHVHHSVNHGTKDRINVMNDAHWAHDERVHVERFKNNFYIPKELIKGKISNLRHVAFVNKRL